MKNRNRIVLNCLPPANLHMPSISCEILKSQLVNNGYNNVNIIYWNHLFHELTKTPFQDEKGDAFVEEHDNIKLLPFYSVFAKRTQNNDAINRILLEDELINPGFKILGHNHYRKRFEEKQNATFQIIENEIDRNINNDVLLFGISAKFDGWISGILITEVLKKKFPNIKCVIGGFENQIQAETIFKQFEIFDYAIFGEGEIPLLKLCQHLEGNTKIDNVPRLLYRNHSDIKYSSAIEKDSYLDLNRYLDINYDDFFHYSKDNVERSKVEIPIETSRGCKWNKCNFCALNWGYKFRTRPSHSIVSNIKELYHKYTIRKFFFVDNDIVGKNKKEFNTLLDSLIDLSNDLGIDFEFHADILHLNFNSELMKKMSLAGFKGVQIGYEGVSDTMLKKLNKSTSFADNILFLRHAQKYDIKTTITGLIIGLPNEKEEDVIESSENLHFLRFILNKSDSKKLQHRFAPLMLFYETPFWKMMTNEERKEFDWHPVDGFLPENFIGTGDTLYSIFGKTKTPKNMLLWQKFEKISNYYEDTKFDYYLIETNGNKYYIEYKDNLKIEETCFDKPEYWEVISLANDKVISFKQLHKKLNEQYPDINAEYLTTILKDLKEKFLLYYSSDMKKIVSVIDTTLIS